MPGASTVCQAGDKLFISASYSKVITIDSVMLGAVRHHLMGKVGLATAVHSEIEFTQRPLDHVYSEDGKTLGASIDSEKERFLQECGEMLGDPVPVRYAHREGYSLTPQDRGFLTGLHRMAERTNWRVAEEVKNLAAFIDEYAPHGGLREGFHGLG